MHNTLEKFYLAVLAYAGTSLKDNVIVNTNPKLGDVMVDDKHLTLPYFENLRNPGDKHIFHPLNENYATPENAHFNLFKKKLTFELNLRLSSLIISMLKVGSEPLVQQRLKSEEAINLVASLGEIEMDMVANFVGLVKASQAENKAPFIFDIYLKKNGTVGETPYLAIGKINFMMYRELQKALEDKDMGYKVYGHKLRKKDIIALINVFRAIFPNIDSKDDFIIGTDNKVFRYFSALLLASYPVAHRMNEIADLLEEAKDPSLCLEDIRSDLSWANYIQDLYPLTDVIREIPNQTDLKTESHQLAVDESKVKEPQKAPPVYSPPAQQQPQQPMQQMPQQTQMAQHPAQPPGPEDIIRASLNRPMMQPGMMAPGMMPMQQGMMPMQPGMMPMQQGVPVMTPQGVMMMPAMQAAPQMQPVQQQTTGGWTSFSPTPVQPQPGMMTMQPGMMQMPQAVPMMTPQGVVMVQPGTPMMGQGQPAGIPLNPHLMGSGHTFG